MNPVTISEKDEITVGALVSVLAGVANLASFGEYGYKLVDELGRRYPEEMKGLSADEFVSQTLIMNLVGFVAGFNHAIGLIPSIDAIAPGMEGTSVEVARRVAAQSAGFFGEIRRLGEEEEAEMPVALLSSAQARNFMLGGRGFAVEMVKSLVKDRVDPAVVDELYDELQGRTEKTGQELLSRIYAAPGSETPT